MAKRYRVKRLRDGRRHLFETDSAADYLRCLIDEMAGDFSVWCDISVTEYGVGTLLVDVRSIAEANRPAALRYNEFCDELSQIFNAFYDCQESSRECRARTWRVRHRSDCPWI